MKIWSKRTLSVLLGMCVAAAAIPLSASVSAYDGNPYEQPTLNDNGTPDDTSDDWYEIANYSNLQWFAIRASGETPGYRDVKGKLVADITCTYDKTLQENGHPTDYFPGIGSTSSGQGYQGTFDGQGHTISNLYAWGGSCGLFNTLNSGTVMNLTLKDSEICGITSDAGGICQNPCYGAKIINCHVKNTKITGRGYVGGICAEVFEGVTINDCTTDAQTTVTNTQSSQHTGTGGICGKSFEGTKIQNCVNNATVDGSNTGEITNDCEGTGGILGLLETYGNQSSVFIEKCINNGKITGNVYSGGILGSVDTGNVENTITNCYNTGAVSNKDKAAGGIFGYSSRDGIDLEQTIKLNVSNCYNIGEVTNGDENYAGGIFGKADEYTQVKNSYQLADTNADFDSGVSSATIDRFKSGEIAYLLSEGKTDANTLYRQNVDNSKTAEDYPRFNNGSDDDIVYQIKKYETCDEATATANGYSNTYSEEGRPDHTWGEEYTIDRVPSCTEDGLQHKTCTVCGKDSEPIVIPATGHNMTKTDAVKPTCIDDGNIEYYSCDVCGKLFADAEGKTEITDVVDPATGHTWGEWTVKTEPTETEEGVSERVCTACGEVETKAIPMLEPSDEPSEEPSNEPSEGPSEKPGNEPSDEPSNDNTVKTGDNSLAIWFALALVASGVTAFAVTKRKNTTEE